MQRAKRVCCEGWRQGWCARRAPCAFSVARRSSFGVAHASGVLRKPVTIARVQQASFFPGMPRRVRRFKGEHVYHHGKHTLCMLSESTGLVVLSVGVLVGVVCCAYVHVTWTTALCYGAGLVLLTRRCIRGRVNRVRRDLTGRHVVITGGTSGIGRATAAQLARMGADVTILSRDSAHVQPALTYIRAQCKDASRQRIQFTALDLADLVAVRDCCKRLLQRGRPVDLLINNAGVVHPQKVTTRFGEDALLAVNLFGPYLLTEGLLPLLRAARGRVVYVTCSTHVAVPSESVASYLGVRGTHAARSADGYDSLVQYGFAKLGNIYHAQQLASRASEAGAVPGAGSRPVTRGVQRAGPAADVTTSHAETAFTVCVCTPGAAITNLYRDFASYPLMCYGYRVLLLALRTAWEGSQTVVNCAVCEEVCDGGYYMNCRYKPNGLSEAACDARAREQVMAWVHQKMQPYMKWD